MKITLLSIITLLFISPVGLFADAGKAKRFNSLDQNKDGHITLEEYTEVRLKWNAKNTAELSAKYFKYNDTNKDGKVTLEEFTSK